MTGPYDQPHPSPYGPPAGGMSREQLEAEVARLRAAEGFDDPRPAAYGVPAGPGGPLEIERSTTTPPPAPAPVAPQGRPETADEQVARRLAEQDAAEVEDYGAFWSEQGEGKRLKNVHGRDLVLPRAMPLRFELESRRLQGAEDVKSVRYLFDILYGSGTWDDLIARGADAEQLPVLLMWGTLNLSGRDTTLAQARAMAHEMSEKKRAGQGADGDQGSAEGNLPAPGIPGGTSAAAGG